MESSSSAWKHSLPPQSSSSSSSSSSSNNAHVSRSQNLSPVLANPQPEPPRLPPPSPPLLPTVSLPSRAQTPFSSSSGSVRETPLSASSQTNTPQSNHPSFPLQSPNFRKNLPPLRIPGKVAVQRETSAAYSRSSSEDVAQRRWKPLDDSSGLSSVVSTPFLPSSVRVRSCDVYIGYPNSKPDMIRFTKWLRAELELTGISCFAADRSKCKNVVERSTVEKAANSASFGVVIITKRSFSNPHSMYELSFFSRCKNLVPIFFGLRPSDCMATDIVGKRGHLWEKHGGCLWNLYGGREEEWTHAVNSLSTIADDWSLEAHFNYWRCCISEAVLQLGTKLGKRSAVERVNRWNKIAQEEFPFPRNNKFVGRKKDLLELEHMLFGVTNELKRPKIQDKGKQPSKGSEGDYGAEKYGNGIACISGPEGMGKTELLLEFGYRVAQRYKMVLWVDGEERYMRQSYMNLLHLLDIDVSLENQLFLEKNRFKTFEELEKEVICRVRKELMRDIPFLLVIDNMEREKDWWGRENIVDLLPCLGGETHVIISTRLPRIMEMEPLRLSHLSDSEAISLMKGAQSIEPGELNVLRILSQTVGRVTSGLALIGGILSAIPISSLGLLNAIERVPDRDLNGLDEIFRRNPFLLRLLEVCFFVLDQLDELASKLALASGSFAPSPIPISLLALTSSRAFEAHPARKLWKKLSTKIFKGLLSSKQMSNVEESTLTLVDLGLARTCTKLGYIQFHAIIRLFARVRSDSGVAYAMIESINSRACLPQDNDHIWAACFLLFNFAGDVSDVELKYSELLSFIKRLALPLARYIVTNFSQFKAALELMHLCTDALERLEEVFLSQMEKDKEEKSICSKENLSPLLYKESILLKATLLETRAKLMLQGGDYDVGEQLCRSSISIREVFYGWYHPETVSSHNTMGHLIMSHEKI